MKRWQAVTLYFPLTLLGLFVSFLPRRLELYFGKKLGRLLLHLGGKRKSVALDNIRRCFPELQNEGWQKLLKKNFLHYGILIFELLHLFSPLPGHYRRYCKKITACEGVEHWRQANARGKGVLFVSSHLGNWELMAAAGGLLGMPLTIVTKHLKPEWLHKKIEKSRASTGVSGVYEPRTLPQIMRALRKGESVGFVLDQYAGPPIGIPVRFFGVKVGTLAAVGTLVARTGAAVVLARTYRDSQGILRISVEPELNVGNYLDQPEEKVTEVLAARIEAWVRQEPDQWLWIHRRFKNVVWPQEFA